MITEEIKTLLRAIVDERQMQHRVIGDKGSFSNCSHSSALDAIACMVSGHSCREIRIKPEPLECWVTYYDGRNDPFGSAFICKNDAEENALERNGSVIHMREVIE